MRYKGLTNTPILLEQRKEIINNNKICKLINYIEKKFTNITFSYASGTMKNHYRFIINDGVTKLQREEFYSSIINKLKSKAITNNIIIKDCKRGLKPLAALMDNKYIPSVINKSFSAAGGIELYDISANESYFIDFELKNSGRTNSVSNTLLREITPVILFKLFNNRELKTIFNNKYNPNNLIKLQKRLKNLTDDILINNLSNYERKEIEEIYNFNFDDNLKTKSFIIGINTLSIILQKYKNVKTIKYSGHAIHDSIDDIIVILKEKNKEIKISLKSGKHKSRETTFVGFAKLLNKFTIQPAKKTCIVGNTLFVKSSNGKISNNPENFAKLYFEMLKKYPDILSKSIKNFILPDDNIKVWNITENSYNELTDFYNIVKKCTKINILKNKKNTHYYPMEFVLKNKTINSFRIRWYKRTGNGNLSEYKIIVEPNI